MTDENTTHGDVSAEAPVRRTRSRRVATSGVTTPGKAAPARGKAAPAGDSVVDSPDIAPAAVVEQSAAAAPSTAEAAPAKAPRTRSRRATSAGKAAPAADQAEVGSTAGETAPQAAADEAPAPAATAPRARRSRRATSASTAPSAEAAGSDAAATAAAAAAPAAAAEAAVAAGDATEDAAPTRPTRSRSGRSRSAASKASPEADAPSPAAEDALEAAPEAPSRRRGRSTRGAAATTETSGGDEPTTAVPPTSSVPAAALDVFAAFGTERPETPAPAARTEAPRLPATALLFQAPEPESRPRRRRAVAPAGPPKHDELPAVEELDEETTEVEAVGSDLPEIDLEGTDVSEETEDEDAEEREGGARRRRRRGGRGRRSRSGGDRDVEDAEGPETGETGEVGEETAEEPRRGRGRRRPEAEAAPAEEDDAESDVEAEEGEGEGGSSSSRRRRRRRRGSRGEPAPDESAPVATATRTRSRAGRTGSDEVTALKGSTRLEAKRQRRREGRDAGRRRTIVTESEFLARRESVERSMIVREANDRVQIAVLEDGVLVEHFVSRSAQNGQSSMAGNVYLGRVQNVLPSMEAAFVDVGKGRNAVLYAGEVNWDAAGLEGQPRRIEQALKSGDSVLVQVTKDPIGHKGARLTSQITLAGRYLVYVPAGGMTGISRKLPENERARLKKLLKEIVPDAAGVIVRTAAEGASEEELRRDVQRLQDQWAAIEKKAKSASAPALLQGEPDLAIRVVRDIFNDDFSSLVVQGDGAWSMIHEYVDAMAPDLANKVSRWDGEGDVFAEHRIDEQLAKGMDRKVWLPSGGSLVIDRTEAMTVVDVNTGKFTGSGGTLEETVTRNNLEAAEEIVRQLRLRDIGGIIVIDFIDMVLESNRDLVLRRLVECLGRDRTKHQVAEVTSLGLVQMTRKRVGQGLVEAFSETCQHCNGRGFIVHDEPIDAKPQGEGDGRPAAAAGEGNVDSKRSRRKKATSPATAPVTVPVLPEAREAVKATLATIAAAAAHAHEHPAEHPADQTTEPAADDATGPADEARAEEPAAAELADVLDSIGAVEAPVAPVTADADDTAPSAEAAQSDDAGARVDDAGAQADDGGAPADDAGAQADGEGGDAPGEVLETSGEAGDGTSTENEHVGW